MKSAKALLDSLMGPGRDKDEKDKKGEDFKEDNVCKHYLAATCPYGLIGKTLTKNHLGVEIWIGRHCDKLHFKVLRDEFEAHPNSQRYRRDYEEAFLRAVQELVAEADTRVHHLKRTASGRGVPGQELCKDCGLRYILNDYDPDAGSHKPSTSAQGLREWEVYEDVHLNGKVHKGHLRLRELVAEYRQKLSSNSDREPKGESLEKDRTRAENHRSSKDKQVNGDRSRERRRRDKKGSEERESHGKKRDRSHSRDRDTRRRKAESHGSEERLDEKKRKSSNRGHRSSSSPSKKRSRRQGKSKDGKAKTRISKEIGSDTSSDTATRRPKLKTKKARTKGNHSKSKRQSAASSSTSSS